MKCEDGPEGWLREERAPRVVSNRVVLGRQSFTGNQRPAGGGLEEQGENPQFRVAGAQTGGRKGWEGSSCREVCG